MRRRFMSDTGFKESFDYNNYMTIEALEDDTSVSFVSDIEYGIDGQGWRRLPYGSKVIVNAGQFLSFKGEFMPSSSNIPYNGIGTFTISKKCNLVGNCMSLLFGDDAVNNNSLSGITYAFCELFSGCTTIIQVSETFLPATTLAGSCYSGMFSGCTSLTTAPELPATTLAYYCYGGMFYGCSSLTTAPELPATTLAGSCYSGMFRDCTNLTTAPELPAIALTNWCYDSMFQNCTNLNYIKMLATDISASRCLSNWVYGVASTGTFVKNPNMTSLPTGISGIPNRWTVVNDGEE